MRNIQLSTYIQNYYFIILKSPNINIRTTLRNNVGKDTKSVKSSLSRQSEFAKSSLAALALNVGLLLPSVARPVASPFRYDTETTDDNVKISRPFNPN